MDHKPDCSTSDDFLGKLPAKAGDSGNSGLSEAAICCAARRWTIPTPRRSLSEAAFREYGLPWVIRTDNGPPFASHGEAGLLRLGLEGLYRC